MLLEPGLHQDSHLVHPSWPKLTSFCSHGEMATKLVVCSCGNNSWLPIQYLFYSCIESEPTFHFRAMADNVLPKHLQISYGYVIISGQCHISRETSLNFVLPPTPPQSFVCVCVAFLDYIMIARALAATLEYKGNSKDGRSGFSVSVNPLHVSSRTVGT